MSRGPALGLLLVSVLVAGCDLQRAHQVDLNAASAAALADIPGIGREAPDYLRNVPPLPQGP